MRRIHAIELEDQDWMPRVIRESGMAYLRFAAGMAGVAEQVGPLLEDALTRSGENEILDLCSGGGGPVIELATAFRDNDREVRVTLSDLYPDPGGIALATQSDVPGLTYDSTSVDAQSVPPERKGLRTLFNSFHHLRPDVAEGVLASAVRGGRPIAIVEMLQRKIVSVIGIAFSPIAVFLLVPFLRPFRWIWLPLTYLIPVIPLFILWDGIVSCFRIYNEEELLVMASVADPEGKFDWKVEYVPLPPQPVPAIVLLGVPKAAA